MIERVFVVVSVRQTRDGRGRLIPEAGTHRLVAAFTTRLPATRLAHANNERLRRALDGRPGTITAYEVRACRLYDDGA